MPAANRRPWFQLHFIPWMLSALSAAAFLYGLVSPEGVSGYRKFTLGLIVGAILLVIAAIVEERDQYREDRRDGGFADYSEAGDSANESRSPSTTL